jgi:carboxylesterase
MDQTQNLVNPHLEGKPFFWQAEPGSLRVLLLHGFTATPAEVRLAAQYLHQQGYTVSAPLLPGHGTTPQDLNRCRWQDWVQAVETCYLELIQAGTPVAVLGESMGGLLALHLAAAHPQIAAVSLYAPALQTRHNWMLSASRLISYFKFALPKKSGPPRASDARWQGYWVYPTRASYELYLLQKATRRLLGAVRQPLLIVQGRLDYTVHPSVPVQITSGVGSSIIHIHWMKDSSHCVILDEEWEPASALAHQFLQSVTGVSPGSG